MVGRFKLITICIWYRIYITKAVLYPSNACLVLRCYCLQSCSAAESLFNVDSPVRRSLGLGDDDRKNSVLKTGLHRLLVDTLRE